MMFFFFFSSRRRHTRWNCDWSSDVCSSDLGATSSEPAQLLDGVIAHAVLEDVAPGVGKGPEAFGHVRAHRGALRSGRAFALAALHFLAHLRVHLLERNVADSLLCHDAPFPTAA